MIRTNYIPHIVDFEPYNKSVVKDIQLYAVKRFREAIAELWEFDFSKFKSLNVYPNRDGLPHVVFCPAWDFSKKKQKPNTVLFSCDEMCTLSFGGGNGVDFRGDCGMALRAVRGLYSHKSIGRQIWNGDGEYEEKIDSFVAACVKNLKERRIEPFI